MKEYWYGYAVSHSHILAAVRFSSGISKARYESWDDLSNVVSMARVGLELSVSKIVFYNILLWLENIQRIQSNKGDLETTLKYYRAVFFIRFQWSRNQLFINSKRNLSVEYQLKSYHSVTTKSIQNFIQ